MKHPASLSTLRIGLMAFALALVCACGGGVGSGGTGAPVGVAQGTVNGFGSVIVDGTRFDNRSAPAYAELSPGDLTITEARLGQRVEIGYRQAGVADSLRIDAALSGAVSSIDGGGGFTVLGQPVVVNADPARGPVTQFDGGYAGAADVAAGDIVEVHGVLVPQGMASFIQATRVDKRAALPKFLKVTGRVSLLANNGVFALGTLSVDAGGAAVVKDGPLANGQVVAVLARPASLTTGGTGPRLVAAQVRVRTLDDTGAEATVSGRISALDTAARRFTIADLRVDYSATPFVPANDWYVQVRGVLTAAGVLKAEAIVLRDGKTSAEAELKGNIAGFEAATRRFRVRGVAVDASSAHIEGCAGGVLAEGLYVEVEGRLNATGVIAKEVKCESESEGATIEREGLAGSVNAGAASFVLTTGRGPVTVHWSARTYFKNISAQTLAGARVEVEGVLAGGVLEASKVSLEH